MPIAAYAHIEHDMLHLTGRVCSIDGSVLIDVQNAMLLTGVAEIDRLSASHAGTDLAREALKQGAAAALETAR